MRHLHHIMLLACSGCVTGPEPGAAVAMDTQAVLTAVAAYRDSSMFQVVSTTYPSALGGAISVELYASRSAAASYAAIAPEITGSGAKLPVGGIIVREVLDASGTAQKLTVMAKGPAGYNPAIGDWYWAVTDLHGVPVVESGTPRSGQLVDCYGCHLPRSADDFLFGVPMVDRSTGVGMPPPQGPGGPVCGDFACETGETMETCPKDCNHGHTH